MDRSAAGVPGHPSEALFMWANHLTIDYTTASIITGSIRQALDTNFIIEQKVAKYG